MSVYKYISIVGVRRKTLVSLPVSIDYLYTLGVRFEASGVPCHRTVLGGALACTSLHAAGLNPPIKGSDCEVTGGPMSA